MRRLLLGAIAWLGMSQPALGADVPKPLFDGQQTLHLTLTAPFGRLIGNRGQNQIPVPATLTEAGSPAESLPVQLTVRGITRRQAEICQFPPLRVEFTDKPPAGSVFHGQKKLKLVTYCNRQPRSQQLILLEYATYRMFNLLTPLSFDVRPAEIDYLDTNGRPEISRLGFFIEDAGDLAKRNGLREAKTDDRIPVSALDPASAARGAVFEYLIGNLDWSMIAGPAGEHCCHNVKLLGVTEDALGGLVPAIYDFDFSGLVDAPYATPPAGLNVASVRVRRYRGYCSMNSFAASSLADAVAKRTDLLAVLDSVPELDPAIRAKARHYLKTFFDQASSPGGVKAILSTCTR